VTGCDSWFGGSCQRCCRGGLGRGIRGPHRFAVVSIGAERAALQTHKKRTSRMGGLGASESRVTGSNVCTRRKGVESSWRTGKKTQVKECRRARPSVSPQPSSLLTGAAREGDSKETKMPERGMACFGPPPVGFRGRPRCRIGMGCHWRDASHQGTFSPCIDASNH
jgi:hypothetical protein